MHSAGPGTFILLWQGGMDLSPIAVSDLHSLLAWWLAGSCAAKQWNGPHVLVGIGTLACDQKPGGLEADAADISLHTVFCSGDLLTH